MESISFSLSRLIDEQIAMINQKAKENGLLLDFTIAPELPDLLKGDPLRLGQILANLLNNAVKFTEKGAVSLTVKLNSQSDDNLSVSFQVKDSGIGIPQERLKEIFSPFTQSDTSITRRYGGTGLGLTISSQLAKLMGGEITVESREGNGSTFLFTVHLKKAASGAACELPEQALLAVKELQEQSEYPSVIEEAKLQPLLKELERHLRRQNMGALNTFNQVSKLLHGNFIEELAEMETLLSQLDFSKALPSLQRLAEKTGIKYR